MKKNVDIGKRGAYLHKTKGGATRGGAHKNKKKEISRNFCRRG